MNFPASSAPTRVNFPAQSSGAGAPSFTPAAGTPAGSAAPEPAAPEPGATDTWDMPVRPPDSGDQQPVPAPAPDPNDRGRALIIPVEDPAPKASPVAPVLPQRPDPIAPPTPHRHEPEVAEGGRRCPWCATPNPVDRHFCLRCAMSLEEKPREGPVRRPWWRRMLDWRNRPIPYAGQRPRLRRGPGQLVRLLIALLVIALIAAVAATWGGEAISAIEDHFAHPNLQPVQNITASTSGAGQGSENLTDGWNNTWWGSGTANNGTSLDVRFRQPTNLLDLIVTPGAGFQQQDYETQDSPRTMSMTMISQNGQSTTQTLQLGNSPGAHIFPVHGDNITRIHFVISTVNQGSAANPQVAIAELEFFSR